MGIEKILVVDDEPLSLEFLSEALQTFGYETLAAPDAEKGLEQFQQSTPDLVLTDLKMPGMDGLTLLSKIKAVSPETPVVVLTAFGTVESAVGAMKSGATDFLLKPVSPDSLELVVRRVADHQKLKKENEYLRQQSQNTSNFIGESPAIRKILQEAEKVAKTKATVLVTGESGTGKERIAQRIHEASTRAKKPFIRVNCAALSESLLESELFGHEKGAFTGAVQKREGRFELADGGSLLLDEIGELPLNLQAKLLRVLEEEEFERVGGMKTLRIDVRVIATTNRDLAAEVAKGRFREDLYYRLNVVPIQIPPLRARREDTVPLAEHFLKHFAGQYGSRTRSLSESAKNALMQYGWPGNVRELENIIQRVVVRDRDPIVEQQDLAADLSSPASSPETKSDLSALDKLPPITPRTLEDIEREVILNTLDLTKGNKTEAAKILGVSARTLFNKMKQYQAESLVKKEVAHE